MSEKKSKKLYTEMGSKGFLTTPKKGFNRRIF